MGTFEKMLGPAPLDASYAGDAVRQGPKIDQSNSVKVQATSRNKISSETIDSIHQSPKVFTSTMATKRALQADPEAPDAISKKRAFQNSGQDLVIREAMARIVASDKCRTALESATINKIPEVFIDTKEKGLRVANVGKDVIFLYECDQSLISTGQVPQGPTAWGRAFIYLPNPQKLEVLDDFSKIKSHEPSMSLLSGVAEVGDITSEAQNPSICAFSAAARLDLMLRFGLLGCEKNVVQAQKAKEIIPNDRRADAYSFALQNAVEYNDMNMIRYCLDNEARPISPDEGRYDYREDSPIEIAFVTGTPEIQKLLVGHLNKITDLEEIRNLFFNESRWEVPPKAIIDFIDRV